MEFTVSGFWPGEPFFIYLTAWECYIYLLESDGIGLLFAGHLFSTLLAALLLRTIFIAARKSK